MKSIKEGETIKALLKLEKNENAAEIFTNQSYLEMDEIDLHFKRHLEKLNFLKLTKIQKEAFRPLIEGRDVLLKSQTGSGKTLAYLVPLINNLIKKFPKVKRKDGCMVMIITHTRELSLQIYKILEKLTKGCIYIVPGVLIGGIDTKKEKARIRKGLNIVVGTPGRLAYHLEHSQNFEMYNLEAIIFEEADQILQMGFYKELDKIIRIVQDYNVQYQKILASASITNELESLLEKLVAKPVPLEEEEGQEVANMPEPNNHVEVQAIFQNFETVGFGKDLKKFSIPKTLNHFYILVEARKKMSFFITLLKLLENQKILVFLSTADQANYFHSLVNSFKTPSFSFNKRSTDEKFFKQRVLKIHGYMDQKERSEVFYEFNTLEKGVLLCTDIASRGLDFKSLSVIVLFDVSPSYKAYVNRVGRTARIENIGSAISILFEEENKYAKKLENNCKAVELPMQKFERIFSNQNFKNQEKKVKNFSQFFDISIRKMVNGDKDMLYLARRAFNSFCRAYSLLKDIECFKLKKLNLHKISKAYGLESSRSNRITREDGYKKGKDAKNISFSERRFLDMKKLKTREGLKIVQNKNFTNDEFQM